MILRRAIHTIAAMLFLSSAMPSLAQSTDRIPLSQLQEMFDGMRAKTKWNVDGPLLWGYFFYDSSQAKLKHAAEVLAASGYRIVGIEREDKGATFRLHVEKVEVHTPASLHMRNDEFYKLAAKYGIASYDGMDVGPAPTGGKK